MTIDEAIKHAEEVANDMELCCKECAKEHKQLAEWLKELKQLKEQKNEDLIAKIDKLPRIKVGNSNSPTVKYCIDEILLYDLFEHYKKNEEE